MFGLIPVLHASEGVAAPAGGGAMQMIILLGGFILLMYLFMIRPQQKRQQQQKKLQSDLKINDFVLLTSGIYGRIASLPSEHTVTLEIASGVIIYVVRSQVFAVVDAKKEGVDLSAASAHTAVATTPEKPKAKKPAAKKAPAKTTTKAPKAADNKTKTEEKSE